LVWSYALRSSCKPTSAIVAGLVALALVLRSARGFAQFSTGRWQLPAGALGAVALLAWLPPLIQRFTTEPGNLAQVFRFFMTHSPHRSWHEALRVVSTLFGTFPLRRGPHGTNIDAELTWLASVPVRRRPW
jgi:hypothetical protein